ncbi:CBM35 domain-containing protein [Ruminiclostridium cellulolyticum]|uniref:Carbohydrate binding family 6 n=1 Tax=Ruminiclostridium cellulolyticum (strain ATCC 35319 / DSM 5812 / JCM 6584 / H10) TaxID=394503 RepID=B8I0X3_RUMCH|nr:CBM35 domain-containing protein [Ruminiclostridium cellulolyticum]ACL77529.1 protein of unknown function DUF291 [Ruminiclostridium cellulolyticum H10]
MRKKSLVMLSLAIVLSLLLTSISYADVTSSYQNPLMRGADPTIARAADGFYYSCFAVDNDIYLKKADTILGVGTAKSRLAWDKPADFGYVWGPYIYRLDGKWYIYFTSAPENSFGYGHPSSYVLENTSPDPFEGTWELKGVSANADEDGQVTDKPGLLNTQGYGLACGVVTMGGKTYFTYTKYFYYPDPNDPTKEKFDECPTIVEMENPWTLKGTEGTLARPVYDWEKQGDSINEGAAVVERNGKVYFAYSASSFMNDNYCVGVSTADAQSDLLQESNWTKNPEPALAKSPENSSFGPGSPLFVKSEDGTEDWLIYHGGPVGGQTGSNRWVRAQRINWNDDGSINLGIPSNPGTVLDRPSGEEKSETYEAEDASFAGVTRTILSDSSKASGSGVMKYDNSSNGYVEFTVDANMPGSYSLNFRYNNSTGSNITMSLGVNQNSSRELSFEPNGSNSTNYDLLRVHNVQLNAGHNKIRLSSSEANGLVLDAMIIKKSVLYEAENAALSGGALVSTEHSGYSGTGFVGGMYTEGTSAEFTVDAPYAGNYSVNLRYCNGFSNIDKTLSMYVNGVKVKQIDLFSFGDWSKWSERYDNIELRAGSNTITYKYDSGDGGNVNLDYITVTEATTRHYEAENAVLTGNAQKSTDHTGYTGTGFVGGFWTEGSVEFSVNVETAALYDVKLKYALGFPEDRTMSIYLNGSKVKQVTLPSTGGWDTWSEYLETLSLNKGNNTISIKRDSDDSGDINIDSIHLDRRISWKYQAEDATLLGGAHPVDDHLWYEGTGFAGGFETLYESIQFNVNVPNTATYTTTLRYSGAQENDITMSLYVNGTKIKQVSLPPTADWDSWGEATETVNLKAGKNVIEYKRDDGDTGRFNIDSMTIDKYSVGDTDLKNRGIVSGTVYTIKAKHSGKALDVSGYSSEPGALVDQWTYVGGNNQRWEIIDLGTGYYKIKSAHSGLVLDIVEGSPDMDLCQTTSSPAETQQWILEKVGGYYKIVNKSNGMVLDVSEESYDNGKKVHLYSYVGKANQLWKIDVASANELFIPVTGITDVPVTATAGTDLTLFANVLPYNATNKSIEWRVKDAGETGATISGNTLSTVGAGTVLVTAVITDGMPDDNAYTQDYIIQINAVNHAPTAKANIPVAAVAADDSVSFIASDIAEDEDGDTLTIAEIKTSPDSAMASAILDNGTVTVSGVAPGSTDATLVVSDGRGGTVEINVPIEVAAAPDVKIDISQSPVKTIFNALTFGLFFNDSIDVSLSSGKTEIDHFEYQIVGAESPFDSNGTWTTGNSFSVEPDFMGRVYARAVFTDGAVTETYIKALVVDKTKPEIGAVYDKDNASIAVTVSDISAGIDTITYQVGSGEVKSVNLTPTAEKDITFEYSFTISSLPEGQYDVVINAIDNSDNAADTKTLNIVNNGVASAEISPVSESFDINVPADVSTTITWNDASSVTDVVYGGNPVTSDSYEVSGDTLTLKSSYLASLGLVNGDTSEFIINFDRGNPVTFVVSIIDSSDPTPVNRSISVQNDGNGTASANVTSATEGTEVTLTATPNEGYRFKEWQVIYPTGLAITGNTFTMPNGAVSVKAIFEQNPVVNYTLSVNGSYSNESGAGSYVEGSTVTINAGSRSNYTFRGWSSGDGVTFANANSTTTTFTMPAKNVTVTASWTYNGSSPYNGTIPSQPATKDYTADIKVSGASGNSTLPITVDAKTGTARLDTASRNELVANGGISVITVPSIPDVDTYSVGIPVPYLSTADWQGSLRVSTNRGSITVPSNMLTGIAEAAGTKAEITIGKGDKATLTEAAKTAIGDRPLIQLTMYIDGKQMEWNNPNVPVMVTIPYTPSAEELANPERIIIWYIDDNGKAVAVPNGHYDPASGTVAFDTTHFSSYAIGYSDVSFNDVTENAWYNKAVSFIAARDITAGTGNGYFSPNAKLTRGEFIVMLMKAYEIAPDGKQSSNFEDAGNKYYTGYLAAAKRLGISEGIGKNMFAPEKQITRQEMFTMLYNALKTMDKLPQGDTGKSLSSFDDEEMVASWARDAMTLLVETGIVGGNAGQLTPASTTTRSEMAQVLYNLIYKN